jgi:hypothetical protein
MLRYLALQRVSLPQPYVRAPDAWCHRWRQLRRAYVSIRQHMSAYVSIRAWRLASSVAAAAARIRQHTSAYEPGVWRHRWRQLRRACKPTPPPSAQYLDGAATAARPQLPASYVSIRPHTSAYVRIRQHTSAYVLAIS